MENQNLNENEFDLLQLVRYLLKRWWIIVLAVAVFAAGGYFVSKTFTVPQYTTSCRIYVYQENTEIDYNGIVVATQLANDCEVLITGINVSEAVVKELGLNMDPSNISSKLVVTSESNTRILTIEYTDTDPERAAMILNAVSDEASEQIKRIMNVSAVNEVYSAKVPTSPSNIATGRDTVLGAAIGALLAIGVLAVLFLIDDTIRSEDDVERYLGVSTLSAIPISEDLSGGIKISDKTKGVARFLKK